MPRVMFGELDEFRLVRPLGRGGMGEVYLGHDTVLDRAVAIKLIGARTPDAASRERFLIEARAIARLSHPNVVTIYRVGTTGDGRPFLVQELIRGKSLDQLPRPAPWRQVCELAIGIARGLEAAHRRGILHRDVKPANVMLDERGAARLLDFGLAKLTGDGDAPALEADAAPAPASARDGAPTAGPPTRGSPRRALAQDIGETAAGPAPAGEDAVAETREAPSPIARDAVAIPLSGSPPRPRVTPPGGPAGGPRYTAPGSVIGTPRYLAPELWRGEPASVGSDLYALGVMLYELIAGEPPYPQPDVDELQAAARAGGARPLGELAPDAHPAVARLVMRCLALDPRERPGSAAAIAHELEAVIVGAPAVPEGNPYRGLRAFDAEHRGLFFGRGPDVDAIVDRLRAEPLIAIVGDSGIGKSSVCRAGVVPAVLAGGLADRRTWRAVSIVPGRTPWAALCNALELEAGDADALVRALRPAAGSGVLLVIDQLEELVTLSAPAEAGQVAEVLAAIAAGVVPGVKALLAVRGDFLTRAAALPELGAPMTRGLHLLRALAAADLREVVVGPARALGVRYETDAMVDELIEAVAGNPGALPLLSFTLAELWQARDVSRGVIPARALERLGGVEGGLAGHADAVLLALGAGARAAARRIVLRLVTPARTRAVRDRAELVGGDEVAAEAPASGAAASSRMTLEREALEPLVRGRLVVARDTAAGAPSYELAHEALIRSWGTLRDWLDEEAGQLAARSRLQASASEWQRLERRPDLLWTRRQLDEVRALGELTANERAFVEASRRRVGRQRLARVAAIAALPLAAAAIFGGVRLEAARTRAREVAARIDAADAHQAEASRLAAAAAAARADAFRRFDAGDARGPGWAVEALEAEARWAEARRLTAEAHARYGVAVAELEAASLLDAGAARAQMAALLGSQAELAEAARDPERVADLLRRLAAYDPARAASWRRPGRIVLALDRPGRIAVHALRPGAGGPKIAGGFDARPLLERDGARLDEELPPGSYVAVVTLPPDGHVVRVPFVLARGQRLDRALAAVPPRAAMPPRFVYVPEGRFLVGTDGDERVRLQFLSAQPLHEVRAEAFWISRTEVTLEDWIAYLRALPPEERARRSPASGVALEERGGRFVLRIKPASEEYEVAEGEPLVYPERTVRREVRWERMPVTGISYGDARAYTGWLDRTGQVPGARLCTTREWEYAARGVDGRSYPHGEELRPGDANFDETYGRKQLAFGPDEVGSFPASDSPFGVADLLGNAWDWTAAPQDRPLMKGGSYYQGQITALSSNNSEPGVADHRGVRIGLRVCADAARTR